MLKFEFSQYLFFCFRVYIKLEMRCIIAVSYKIVQLLYFDRLVGHSWYREDSTVWRRQASTIVPFPPVNLEALFPKNFRCSSPFQWRRTGNHLPFPWWKVLFTFFFLSITVAATVTGTVIVTGLADSVARTFCPSLANDIYTWRVLCSLELAFPRLPTATWSTFSHFFTLLRFVRTVEAFAFARLTQSLV